MSLVFLMPTSKELSRRIWDLAVQRCLPRKRVQDLWGSLSYTTLPDHPGTEAWVEEPIELTTNPEIVGSVLSSGQPSLMHPDLWNALWSALRPDARPGMRNVIAYCRRPLTGGAGTALIASARASRGLVQVVSFGPNPALRSFCRDTKALLHEIADEEELPDALEQACLNLLARYEISFSPVTAPPGPIRVRIHSPCGYGEVNVPQGI
jgi:hypothetical protein